MRLSTLAIATTTCGFILAGYTLADTVVETDWQPWDSLPDSEKRGIAPYCPGGFVARPLQAADDPTRTFRFDQGSFDADNKAILTGQVSLSAPQLQSQADRMSYQNQDNSSLSGNVSLWVPGISLSGDQADINISDYYAKLQGAEFVLPEQDLRGSAESIELASESQFRATDMAFTRCAPGNNAWQIKSARLEIDNEEQVARAWHSRVEVQRVPVLYLPYISFPLNDQPRTGFLLPTFGSGYFQEYYLHLAPNYDTTLAANYVSSEGLFVENEFRFLTENHNGITDLGIEATDISDDAILEETGQPQPDRRYSITHRQSGQFGDWLGYDLQTRWVSHRAYDLEVTPGQTTLLDYNTVDLKLNSQPLQSKTQLKLNYRTPVADSSKQFDQLATELSISRTPLTATLLQETHWAHDELTPEPDEYSLIRKPQLTLQARPKPLWMDLRLAQNAQYSRFQRDLTTSQIDQLTSADQADEQNSTDQAEEQANTSQALATMTQRIDGLTQLSRPFKTSLLTLTPTVELLYADYRYDNPTELDIVDTYGESALQQSNWRASLDAEGTLNWPIGATKHELTPRLFYAYSPLSEQTGPILDAKAEKNFSLFSRSRFTSVDRVGDLSRLSVELSYAVSPDGKATPSLTTSVSKGIKLAQERLQLDGIDSEDPNWQPEYSPWDLNASLNLTESLSFSAKANIEHDRSAFNSFTLSTDYRPTERIFTNASWQKKDDKHTLSLGTYVPVVQNVAFIGYGTFNTDIEEPALRDYQATQLLMGVDIDSCCWNIRLAVLETAAAEDEDGTSIFLEQSTLAPYFEVTLKGIGAGTGTIENILNRLDFGYAGRLFNTQ